MLWLQLFWSFFQIGLFSFGGGYAALPLIQGEIVDRLGWLDMAAFSDLVTLSQMTPGPIGINAATFVGIQVGGVPGALLATFACVLPSCVIVSVLARLYVRYKNLWVMQGMLAGLRPAVVALIASAGAGIMLLAFFGRQGLAAGLAGLDVFAVVLFSLALLWLRLKKPPPVLVMGLCGVLGGLCYLLTENV